MTILVSRSRLWHLERELRILYAERRPLTRAVRNGELTPTDPDLLEIQRRIDELELEEEQIMNPNSVASISGTQLSEK